LKDRGKISAAFLSAAYSQVAIAIILLTVKLFIIPH